jgi:hypothetical protein
MSFLFFLIHCLRERGGGGRKREREREREREKMDFCNKETGWGVSKNNFCVKKNQRKNENRLDEE